MFFLSICGAGIHPLNTHTPPMCIDATRLQPKSHSVSRECEGHLPTLRGTGCVSRGRQEAVSLLTLAAGTSDKVEPRLPPLKGTRSQRSPARP